DGVDPRAAESLVGEFAHRRGKDRGLGALGVPARARPFAPGLVCPARCHPSSLRPSYTAPPPPMERTPWDFSYLSDRGSSRMSELFARFSRLVSHFAGRPATFALAALLVFVWAVSGSVFGFSETWQLVINTATTII